MQEGYEFAENRDISHDKIIVLPTHRSSPVRIAIGEWGRKNKEAAQPSVKRNIAAALSSTASVNRRQGSALPVYIAIGGDPTTALEIATHIDPFGRALNTALPIRSRNTIRWVSRIASLSKTHRRKIIRHLTKISLELEPQLARRNACLPEHSPARLLNIPLIALLARSLEYPGLKLPVGRVKGMNIAGYIPAPNALAERGVFPSTDGRCVKRGLLARNRKILRALAKSKDMFLREKRWEMSMIEYEMGWLSNPTPLSKYDKSNAVIPRAFSFPSNTGPRAEVPSYRLPNAKSHVNLAVGAVDAYPPKDIDTFIVLDRINRTYGATNLRMWAVDFPNSYKTI